MLSSGSHLSIGFEFKPVSVWNLVTFPDMFHFELIFLDPRALNFYVACSGERDLGRSL